MVTDLSNNRVRELEAGGTVTALSACKRDLEDVKRSLCLNVGLLYGLYVILLAKMTSSGLIHGHH